MTVDEVGPVLEIMCGLFLIGNTTEVIVELNTWALGGSPQVRVTNDVWAAFQAERNS